MLIQGGFLTPLADLNPMPERRQPSPGSLSEAARADHQHPRLTSATNHTLAADGYADVTFTRTFDTEPAIAFASLSSDGGPIPEFTGMFVRDAQGVYTGIRVYGEKKRALPLLTGILLIGPLVTSLTGFKAWEPASGARVSVVAIQAS